MNKPIIIDGVDVSGCVRLAIDNISCDLGGECKGWENCYYKQLQRLKAENERLKKENEELKKEINKLDKKHEDYCNIMYWQMKEQMDKYSKALEEVREITKKYYISDKKLLATGIMINPYNAIIEIQDKINEVLKDEKVE